MRTRQRSSSVLLAAVYLVLVIYASLYPFEGWRWPPGTAAVELVALPWPPWRSTFDEWSNLLGYVPLGALLCTAMVRSGGGSSSALALGVFFPTLLSFVLEVGQQFVPVRVPSLRDLALNAAGALVGSVAATLAIRGGLLEPWQRIRERWILPDSSGAVVLLVLWPVALLFPAPVALGLGQIFDDLRVGLGHVLEGTPWEPKLAALLPASPREWTSLAPLQEGLAIALGLLAPALLALVVTRPGWRRLLAVVGAAALAIGATTLSTLLNFGPAHAFEWITPAAIPGIAVGTAVAVLVSQAGPRLLAALGLVALTALVALVGQADPDPYYAASLLRWEQGRFVRFHGLAQWVGWLWPYAAMIWLLARLSRRD